MRSGRTGIVEYRLVLNGLEQPLSMLHEAIATFAGAAALGPASRKDFELLLEELVTNIFDHGYGVRRPGRVHVGLRFTGQTVRITVCDRAPAFNSLAQPSNDGPATLEDASVGGAGIALVHRLIDDARYGRVAGRNMLTMHLRKRSRRG